MDARHRYTDKTQWHAAEVTAVDTEAGKVALLYLNSWTRTDVDFDSEDICRQHTHISKDAWECSKRWQKERQEAGLDHPMGPPNDPWRFV